MNKFNKVLLISAVILFILAIALGVYFAYQKIGSSPKTLEGESDQNTKNFPSSPLASGGDSLVPEEGIDVSDINSGKEDTTADYSFLYRDKLFALTLGEVVDYWIAMPLKQATSSTSTLLKSDVYYLNKNGNVMKVLEVGKEEKIVSSSFGEPISLKQNHDGSKIVAKFSNGKFYLFDLSKKIWQDLGDGVVSVSFSPDGKKIAYIKNDKEKQSLYTKDLASKNSPVLISSLYISDYDVFWGEANKIYLLSKPSFQYSGQIWFFDLAKKTLTQFSSGKGMQSIFSNKLNFALLFTNSSRDKVGVSVADKSGKILADLPFSTMAEKCSFSLTKKEAYCSVPFSNNKEFSLTLPDDFLKKAVYFKDLIYKVDLESSKVSVVFNVDSPVMDVVNLKEVSNQLFFINRYDNKLYLLNLE